MKSIEKELSSGFHLYLYPLWLNWKDYFELQIYETILNLFHIVENNYATERVGSSSVLQWKTCKPNLLHDVNNILI